MIKDLTEERVIELIHRILTQKFNPIEFERLRIKVNSLEKEYFGTLERNP